MKKTPTDKNPSTKRIYDDRLHYLPYRPGVGIMLINEKKEIFAGRRIDSRSEAWQMPQGGIDRGETPLEAVLRELAEEIGTREIEILKESKEWFYYDLPAYLVDKLWRGRYRGQRQKWFAMRFLGEESDININTSHPEFMDWKWVSSTELPNLIVPFKRELYINVLREFEDILK